MLEKTQTGSSTLVLQQLYNIRAGTHGTLISGNNGLKRPADDQTGSIADQLGLSDDAKQKVWQIRSQLEVNMQVFSSMHTANGTTTSSTSLSFKETLEFLQTASGETPTTGATATDPTAADPVTEPESDALSRLMAYFSPEKTAQRILDVAMSFFGVSEVQGREGDTEGARRTFADFIGGAINEGFKQARGILGAIPENIASGIDKTHALVFGGLEDFVKNGVSPEKLRPGGVMEKIAAYRLEGTQNLEQVKKTFAPTTYNSQGEAQEQPTESPKISTTG
jgi:hypothetical protein